MPTKNPVVLEDPVGLREVAARLRVSIHTARMWRNRGRMPQEACTVSNVPLWSWAVVEKWANETGRMAEARRRSRSNGQRPTTPGPVKAPAEKEIAAPKVQEPSKTAAPAPRKRAAKAAGAAKKAPAKRAARRPEAKRVAKKAAKA
jgi:hypothetical protein